MPKFVLKQGRTIEITAVLFNLLYTFFYLRGNPVCFLFGFLSPMLFIWLTWRKKIYADAFLQLFYVSMAVYGFVTWGGEWKKIHWEWTTHLAFITAGSLIAWMAGTVLRKHTDARLPYIDSFTTVFAMTGTWLMMNFVHENWLYFIVVNCSSVVIYYRRGLYLGAFMFVLYLVMSIDGYFELNIFSGW